MRVLVTGGAGFIGSQVVRELALDGHTPVVLDSLRPDVHGQDATYRGVLRSAPAGSDVGAEFIHADVRDRAALTKAMAGTDAVAHLAAKVGLGVDLGDLDDYVSSNDLGTAATLQAMATAGIHRLALASSMVVYGEGAYRCATHGPVPAAPRRESDLKHGIFDPPCPHCGAHLTPELVSEDAPIDPRNGYAATKLHQEHLAAVWARETSSDATALRFHNVYGPGMPRNTPYAGVAAIFRSALADGRAPTVLEDGGQRRDFVHVRDVAKAVVAALVSPPPSSGSLRSFNVGSGTVRTIGELAQLLSTEMSGPAPVMTGGYRLGDVRHVTASSERAARELGWRATIDLTMGVHDLVT